MGEDPRQIRREIEETRGRMTETVDAIGYRADVKTRTKDAIAHRKDAVMDRAHGIVDRVVGAAPDHIPSPTDVSMPGFVPDGDQVRHGVQQAKQGARQAVSVAQANPLGLGIGAVAVGFLAGMMLPSTRAENERLGDLSDTLKQQARQVGQEALDHGKQIAQDAAQSASEAVQQSGQEHGEQLADSMRASVDEIRSGDHRS
jgi:gas vesicle protein